MKKTFTIPNNNYCYGQFAGDALAYALQEIKDGSTVIFRDMEFDDIDELTTVLNAFCKFQDILTNLPDQYSDKFSQLINAT